MTSVLLRDHSNRGRDTQSEYCDPEDLKTMGKITESRSTHSISIETNRYLYDHRLRYKVSRFHNVSYNTYNTRIKLFYGERLTDTYANLLAELLM